MVSIFSLLDKFFMGLMEKRIKLGSLDEDQVLEIINFQKGYLKDIYNTLDTMDKDALIALRTKYLQVKKRNDKWPIQDLIKRFPNDVSGKAQALERACPFSSCKAAAKSFLGIIDEIPKGLDTLFEKKSISLDQAKITDVMFLGILREMDVFTKYFGYFWEYFTIVLDDDPQPAGYRQEYLSVNYPNFISIVSNIVNKDKKYSFLKDVDRIKRSNADLVLYAHGNSFLPFLNRKNYTMTDERYLSFGIIGFNIIGKILEFWDMWKHSQYLKMQKHREWLKHEQARLMQIYQDIDKNSPEAAMQKKYIDAYSDEIADLDKKINKYEGTS